MNEISLIIQSVCLEAAAGLMLFLAIGRLREKELNGKLAAICASVLAVAGVLTSITHLGQPLRAFNSLLNLGSSWLSRETLCVALFTACCVLCLGINLWKPAMKTALRVLEWAAAVIGLVLLFIMGSIYDFASVPVWDGANTYIEYYTTAIILGAILFFAGTYKQQDRRSNKALGAVALAAMAVQIIGSELHMADLGAGGTAAGMSAAILSANGVLIAVKWALLVGGVAVFCLRGTTRMSPKLATVTAGGAQATVESGGAVSGGQVAWISVCAVFIAAFIGKVLFFASMVTTGIGIQ